MMVPLANHHHYPSQTLVVMDGRSHVIRHFHLSLNTLFEGEGVLYL